MAFGALATLAVGMTISIVGPSLPDLAARTGVSLSVIGGLVSAIFFGAVPSQLTSGPLADRYGPRPALTVGFSLMMLGLLGVSTQTNLAAVLGAAALTGLGNGLIAVSVFVLVVKTFPERSASALSFVNMFFGVGAILGPLIASAMVRLTGSTIPAFGAVIAILAVELVLLLLVGAHGEIARRTGGDGRPVAGSASIWMLAILVLLYAGTENGITAWSSTTVAIGTGTERASAALVTSAFWVALTSGRLTLVLFGSRLEPERILTLCLAAASIGGLLLVAVQTNLVLSGAAFVVIGFAFGPIFPTSLSIVGRLFPESMGTATSIVVASASAGSILIPWAQGVLLDRGGAGASVLLILGFEVVMLVFVQTGLRFANRTKAARV